MIKDGFTGNQNLPSEPAWRIFEIAPDYAADLGYVTTGLSVVTRGRVRVTTFDGTTEIIMIEAGYFFPLHAKRVWQSGTTATGICGFI